MKNIDKKLIDNINTINSFKRNRCHFRFKGLKLF